MFETIKSLLPALFSTKSRSIEEAKKALSRRNINRAEQLQYLQDNQHSLFDSFKTLSSVSPIKAVQNLLEINTILHEKSRPFFWRAIQKPIGELLKTTTDEAKKSIYPQILKSAPKGAITDLIL
jgi:DNA-directed RNA polymerase subunit F